MNNQDYVWYTCYGSNLLKKRFMCYIRGGIIEGNSKREYGSRDRSHPVKFDTIKIPYELFFAGKESKWGEGGVAFISAEPNDMSFTLGRRYCITREQFLDVIRQENGCEQEHNVEIDWSRLKQEGTQIIFSEKLYGRIVYLGDIDGYNNYTFTSVKSKEEMFINPPAKGYYNVIALGLKETFGFDDKQIDEYLLPRIS